MKTFQFYGVCQNCYKLDNVVWEAIEDPSDGYRSYLQSIELKENVGNLTFSFNPFATVKVEPDYECNGWKLVDVKDDWVWLRVGTDFDSQYPIFVFKYTPKAQSAWLDFIQEN
jgi:hypothetical protein